MIFGYMAMMLEDRTPWDPQTVYHRNRCKMDSHGNWWVSKKSTQDEPNVNHPFPGFDSQGDPVASEWWALWIDWQHPMAQLTDAAGSAIEAAQAAQDQAAAARQAAEEAGQVDVVELGRKVQTLETALTSLTDNEISQLQTAVDSLQGLIGADVDGVVNKFNEFVAFLAGIGDDKTLNGIIADFTSQLAGKQPVGDYATNERVDDLEEKVDSLVSPDMVVSHLTFPSRTTARMDGSHLILAE